MEKNYKRERPYRIFKKILGPIFNLYYNPKVIGGERVPKEGPIIICGDHTHIYDQCLPILHTKRVVHYMAKKEYFDGKFAFFFRWVGCIPVDRSKKDNDAVEAALEVLRNGGAIGIFPEGTRNRLKDEKVVQIYNDYMKEKVPLENFKKSMKTQDPKTSHVNLLENLYKERVITLEQFQDYIYHVEESLEEMVSLRIISKKEYEDAIMLPFKYGAVSMAKKTGATIVPYGLTGDYKFRSKNLVARFGTPFSVDDMTLGEANEKLFNEIKELMQEE